MVLKLKPKDTLTNMRIQIRGVEDKTKPKNTKDYVILVSKEDGKWKNTKQASIKQISDDELEIVVNGADLIQYFKKNIDEIARGIAE